MLSKEASPTSKIIFREISRKLKSGRLSNRSYSIAHLAKDLKLPKGAVTRILNGKPASIKWAIRNKNKLGLEPRVLRKLERQISLEKDKVEPIKLTDDPGDAVYRYYVEPMYHAVVMAFSLPDIQGRPDKVASRLGMEPSRLQAIISDLLAMGIIRVSKDRSKKNNAKTKNKNNGVTYARAHPKAHIDGSQYKLQKGFESAAFREYQRRCIAQMQRLFDQNHESYIQDLAFTFAPEDLSELRKEIIRFTRKLNRFQMKFDRPREIYHLKTCLFRVTRD